MAVLQVNSTKEPAHAEQRQSARGRPEDKLRLGQQTEAAQPAAAANAGKAQVPKLNLVQVPHLTAACTSGSNHAQRLRCALEC